MVQSPEDNATTTDAEQNGTLANMVALCADVMMTEEVAAGLAGSVPTQAAAE